MSQLTFESIKRIHTAATALLMQTGVAVQNAVFTKDYQLASLFNEINEVLDVMSSAILSNEYENQRVDAGSFELYYRHCGYSAFQSQEYRLRNLIIVCKHAASHDAKSEAMMAIKKAFKQYCYYATKAMDQKVTMLSQRREKLRA